MNQKDLESAFAIIRELHSKPIATRIKAGTTAWPKMLERLPKARIGSDQHTEPLGDLLGIPVYVIDNPNDWPPNLVAILDQKGNAMSAWIIND